MREIVIRVPDLEYLPGGAEALPRPLARLLGRAGRFEAAPDAALARALGLSELPAAGPLSRLASGPAPSGSVWLRFDPVFMLPDLTEVWVEKPVALDFDDPALQPLVAELQQMLAAEGLEWRPEPGCGHGVVELQEAPQVRFCPLAEIPGKRLAEALPQGPGARVWRRLINESQMVFHQYRPLSRADQRGVGLWFWGAGSVPDSPAGISLRVLDSSSDPLVKGLARWLDVTIEPENINRAEIGKQDIVFLHWPLQPDGRADGLEDRLLELHETWLHPARGIAVTILGSHGGWRLKPKQRYVFWRRNEVSGFIGTGA